MKEHKKTTSGNYRDKEIGQSIENPINLIICTCGDCKDFETENLRTMKKDKIF